LVTPKAHFGLLLRSAVPVAVAKKQPFLVKEDAMKAAAGVFFRTYSGPTDACKKLSLGDPKKAIPHIIYYLNKIKASAELQSSLAIHGSQGEADRCRQGCA
jgi:hypothetical protein